MTNEIKPQTPELVKEYCDTLDTSQELQQTATEMAQRAEMEHPINRSASVVAASAVYWAGSVLNERVYQSDVSEACGVAENSIRDCYKEIAEAEGYLL